MRIADFEYRPARITVKAGGRVTVSNDDVANHTVTFAAAEAGPGIDNLRQGRRKTIRLRERGTFEYVCEFHPTMRGTVVVAR